MNENVKPKLFHPKNHFYAFSSLTAKLFIVTPIPYKRVHPPLWNCKTWPHFDDFISMNELWKTINSK